MTSWMHRLQTELAAARALSENAQLLSADVHGLDLVRWRALQVIQAEARLHSVALRVTDAIGGDGFDYLQEDFDESIARDYRLTCVKAPLDRQLRFFYATEFKKVAAAEPNLVEATDAVLIADLPAPLYCVGFSLLLWTQDPFQPERRLATKSPRTIVNDATGDGVVPVSIGPWLPVESGGSHEELLGGPSPRRLGLALPTSLYRDADGRLTALADIKRKVVGAVESQSDPIWRDPALNGSIQEAAQWIYVEGQDADNRHTILAAEIARSFPKGKDWGSGLAAILSTALDSARIAYRLHLYDKSIDALKLMSDLRKGLADDVRAVSTQTSALAAGLWRDAAVALGAVALKGLSGDAGFFILVLTCAYLASSWYLNTRAANEAVSAIKANELTFRSKLYGPMLADDEYREIAGNRYSAVVAEFATYRRLVGFIYCAAVLVVAIFAVWPHRAEVHCAVDHLAHYAGRLSMQDSIPMFPFNCK